jgi:hypothetical protein
MKAFEPLKRYTMKCPKCKTALHFKNICGSRIVEEIQGKKVYDAKCPKENKYFYVLADKQND